MWACWHRDVRGLVVGLLLAVSLLPLAACDLALPFGSDALPDDKQVLRVLEIRYIDLDPTWKATTIADGQPLPLLYSGLTALDKDLRPMPSDAEKIDISPDGMVYTFHLRPGLLFSDGAPITAIDFAYSLNRALNPCVGGVSLYLLFDLKDAATFAKQSCSGGSLAPSSSQTAPLIPSLVGDSIQAPDPATLVLVLAQPDAAFLTMLANPVAYVVERRVVERYGDRWAEHLADNGGQGTSGMYRVKSFETDASGAFPSQSLTLVRDDHFWGAKPKLREVDFLTDIGGTPRYDDYRTGEFEVISWGPDIAPAPTDPLALPGYREDPKPSLEYLKVSWQRPPFDDLRARQAFALALDKARLAKLIPYQRLAATNHLVPEGTPGYNPGLTGPLGVASPSGDPARARALWLAYVADKCGGDATKCPEVLLTGRTCSAPPIPDAVAQAEVTQWQAAMPGLRVRFSGNVGNLFCQIVPAPLCPDIQLFGGGWGGDYPDARDWLAWFDPQALETSLLPGVSSLGCADDAGASATLRRANAERDPAGRIQLYQQAERALIEDVAIIPLWQRREGSAAQPYVKNHVPGSWNWIGPAQWATIYLAKH